MNHVTHDQQLSWQYRLLAPRGAVADQQRREIDRAIYQAKRRNRDWRRNWSGGRRGHRWWRRHARSYDRMKFKWFPVIYDHGVAYYIDFRSRAFREVNDPHLRFTFDSQVGSKMLEEARRQGVRV